MGNSKGLLSSPHSSEYQSASLNFSIVIVTGLTLQLKFHLPIAPSLQTQHIQNIDSTIPSTSYYLHIFVSISQILVISLSLISCVTLSTFLKSLWVSKFLMHKMYGLAQMFCNVLYFWNPLISVTEDQNFKIILNYSSLPNLSSYSAHDNVFFLGSFKQFI